MRPAHVPSLLGSALAAAALGDYTAVGAAVEVLYTQCFTRNLLLDFLVQTYKYWRRRRKLRCSIYYTRYWYKSANTD